MKTRIFLLAIAAALWTTVVGQTKTIVEQQCWLDGNISAAQAASTSVDISALPVGLHSYSIRVKDSEGMWSPVVTKFFIIPRAIEPATNITAREYWLDGKVASRASLDASPAQIALTDLAEGLHSFSMRVKDNNGMWSPVVTKFFIIPRAVEQATSITEREYWLDGQVASRVALDASPAQISLTDLAEGLHSFTMRVKDNNGMWSSPVTKYFLIPAQEPTIARYLYWFDDDKEHLFSGELESASGILPVNVSHLPDGEHTLSWRVADSRGAWSNTMVESFTIEVKTGIGNVQSDNVPTTKVLIDGQLYILHGEKIYTVTGSEVK